MARSLSYHNPEPEETVSDAAPKEAVKAEFAKRLQAAMVEKGWNQAELARAAAKFTNSGDFGRYSVSCYIRGTTLPRPEHLSALAKALGVAPRDLLPTRGVPSAEKNTPPLDLKDMGDGNVWLRVNQAVTWEVAMQIMQLLKDKK